ncbi:MAG: hypothetical protein ACLTDR_00450 [Adlercreutzia equolifaciens]
MCSRPSSTLARNTSPDTKYFSPFTDARAAREMIDIARRVVPLCAATCADWRGLTRRWRRTRSLS